MSDASVMTNEQKHTPGPWVVDRTVALGAYGVWTEYATHPGHDGAGYPSEVCSVFRGNKSDFPQEIRDANAKLIAAAPDLLDACIRAKEMFEDIGIHHELIEFLSEAIDKATN